ncbi:glycosyltransferase family 2 protein [Planctomycetota bacterium]|nr:glycosyltransferase family 2 protein [Planctomycetota bacterium]
MSYVNPKQAIDLIIPAFNEQDNILPLANAIPKNLFRNIYLVDNGSTDHTAEYARESGFEVLSETTRGYGAACLRGLREIEELEEKPFAIAFLDADLSDNPASLPDVVAPIQRGLADFVVASRTKLADPKSLTITQKYGNKLACFLLLVFAGHKYTDLGPMRAMHYEELVSLNMRDKTWGWTVEMQFKAAVRKYAIQEIDVSYRDRHAGKSKISGSISGSIKAGYKIITTILRLYVQSKVSRNM